MRHLFVGTAICTLGVSGQLRLPDPFCVAVTGRKSNDDVYFYAHEYLNCLVVIDGVMLQDRLERFERRRAAEGGIPTLAQLDSLRRIFGFAAPARLGGKGQIAIPPWLDERRGAARSALIVGMGHSFELWDLDHVLTGGSADLQSLAALHLTSRKAVTLKEDRHEPVLPPVGLRRRDRVADQSGLPVQSLRPVRPRHDPIDRDPIDVAEKP